MSEQREERASEEPASPPPLGKSLFYESSGASREQRQRQESQDAGPAPTEWTELVARYYDALGAALETTTRTAMEMLDLAMRVKRQADAFLAKALEQRLEHEQEVTSLMRTRDQLRAEVEEMEARLERIRQILSP